MTHGFFSHWPWLNNFPTLILVKIMPHLNLVAAIIVGRVHLINYAYFHDDKLNMCMPHAPIYPDIPSVTNLNPKHSITDQWQGLGL